MASAQPTPEQTPWRPLARADIDAVIVTSPDHPCAALRWRGRQA